MKLSPSAILDSGPASGAQVKFRSSRRRAALPAALALGAVLASAFLPAGAAAQLPFLVKDILPGPTGSAPSTFLSVNGVFFFRANDGSTGIELWKTDGTPAGTSLVKDIFPGTSNSNPSAFTELNGVLYFKANDGTNGIELWRSDGTSAGTFMVKNIGPGSASGFVPAGPIANVGGTLFMAANDGTNGTELWKSDGTGAGTVMVKDIAAGATSSFPSGFTDLNGTAIFVAFDAATGGELWKSDGTSAGTVMVKDIVPGTGSSNPSSFFNAGGVVYFVTDDGTISRPWKTDGTAAGTIVLSNLVTAVSPGFQLVNGMVVFSAGWSFTGLELWKSDGTPAGTKAIKDINPGPASSSPRGVEMNGTFYFGADDGTHGFELWKSDLTADGTTLVRDINPGSASSNPTLIVNASGTLYFAADNGTNGVELWKSDGTTEGTVMVQDLNPGVASSSAAPLKVGCPRMFLTANDGTVGSELFALTLGGAATQAYADLDGDGYGAGPLRTICAGSAGFAALGTDCDDSDPSIHPGAPDGICNGIDNDCNGLIDDGVVSCACVEHAPGLVGWWRGENNAIDATGNYNGAALNGVSYVPGKVGQAFAFNGASWVQSADIPVLELTNQATLEAWILPDPVAFTNNGKIISKFGTLGNYSYQLTLAPSGVLRLDVSADGTTYDVFATPSGTLPASLWAHVAATFDNGLIRLYINGAKVLQRTWSMSSLYTGGTTSLSLGRDQAGIQYFTGLIDEPAVYNRALTPRQIRAIYDAGSSGMCGLGCNQAVYGLVSWWPGEGTAGDRGVGGNHGSLAGSVSFASGKVGLAFSFPGSTTAYVGLPNSASLQLGSQFTLGAWIKPNTIGSYQQIISKWSFLPGDFSYDMDIEPGGSLRADVSGDGTTYVPISSAAGQIAAGEWRHVAMTFDAGAAKLYINGAMVTAASLPVTSVHPTTTVGPYLGVANGDVQRFNGLIDEPMVFNRALSAAEIQDIFAAGSSGLCGLGLVVGVDHPGEGANALELSAPWPNPSRRTAHVRFQLPAASRVRVEVFDVTGRLVSSLLDDQPLSAGEHLMTWDGRDLAGRRVSTGVYHIRVATPQGTLARRVVMVTQ